MTARHRNTPVGIVLALLLMLLGIHEGTAKSKQAADYDQGIQQLLRALNDDFSWRPPSWDEALEQTFPK